MAKSNTGTGTSNNGADPDFDKWGKEQVGFAPYWSPSEGESVFMRLIGVDERDPEFVRYQAINESNTAIACQQGPKSSAETVMVEKGDVFAISQYASLIDTFQVFLESGLNIRFRLTAESKIKTNTPGRTVWKWELKVDPTQKAALEAFKASSGGKALGAANGTRQLEQT